LVQSSQRVDTHFDIIPEVALQLQAIFIAFERARLEGPRLVVKRHLDYKWSSMAHASTW
jgi:hypothetical protein